MMNDLNIWNQKFTELLTLTKELNFIATNPDEVFKRLNNLSKSSLDEHYTRISGHQGPVNLVKLLVIDKLKKAVHVNQELIDEIINKLLSHDYDYFEDRVDNIDIKNYIKDNIETFTPQRFDKYRRPWSLFFSLFYSDNGEKIEKLHGQIIKELISRVSLQNYRGKKFDFAGGRQPGGESLFYAFYPKEFEDHRYAYQVAFNFNNMVKAMLCTGSEIKKDSELKSVRREVIVKTFDELVTQLTDIKVEVDKLNEPLIQKKLLAPEENTWLLKAGGNENKVDYFLNNNLVAISFKSYNLGNLNDYKSKKDIKKIITPTLIKTDRKPINSINSIYDFLRSIEIGDKIILASGNNKFYGVAKVTSNYEYNDHVDDYRHQRKVEWLQKDHSGKTLNRIKLPQKTLTKYNDTQKANQIIQSFGLVEVAPAISVKIKNNDPKNIILYGPPGTGKTYNSISRAVQIAMGIIPSKNERAEIFEKLRKEGQVKFVTFHQSYSYDDFVVGIKPDVDASQLLFKRHKGIFYEIAEKARSNYTASLPSNTSQLRTRATSPENLKNFVLIIDEINRANISRVFGELITLLEEDKRIGEENELRLTLPNGEVFDLPPNLYLIGTMNTADKSIALVDIALRRRFLFEGYYPDYEKLNEEDADLLKHINMKIYEKKKSADYLIGHTYFMNNANTKTVIEKQIIPLLNEYFSGDINLVKAIFSESGWSTNYNTEKHKWDVEKV